MPEKTWTKQEREEAWW